MHGVKTIEISRESLKKEKVELADAHCHLNMLYEGAVADSVAAGVTVMVTNGGSTRANMEVLKRADGKHVFAAVGIGPDEAMVIDDDEVNFNIQLAKDNRDKIVGIGEIGLDYEIASSFEKVAAQKTVFKKFVDLALELDLPVSVHSRKAMDDVLRILKEEGARKVHLHFFEGDAAQAKVAAERGYYVSVPPMESSKRSNAIKHVPIEQIMSESDAPAAGSLPKDVERSVVIIAKSKAIEYQKAAEVTVANTRRFFNIGKQNLIRL